MLDVPCVFTLLNIVSMVELFENFSNITYCHKINWKSFECYTEVIWKLLCYFIYFFSGWTHFHFINILIEANIGKTKHTPNIRTSYYNIVNYLANDSFSKCGYVTCILSNCKFAKLQAILSLYTTVASPRIIPNSYFPVSNKSQFYCCNYSYLF